MSKAVLTDSEDNNNKRKKSLPAEMEVPQLIAMPTTMTPDEKIDMNLEIAMLDCALRRMCALVALEESLKETPNLVSIARAACDVANTIKYLKSDHVYSTPPNNSSDDIFDGFGFMPFIDMDEDD